MRTIPDVCPIKQKLKKYIWKLYPKCKENKKVGHGFNPLTPGFCYMYFHTSCKVSVCVWNGVIPNTKNSIKIDLVCEQWTHTIGLVEITNKSCWKRQMFLKYHRVPFNISNLLFLRINNCELNRLNISRRKRKRWISHHHLPRVLRF